MPPKRGPQGGGRWSHKPLLWHNDKQGVLVQGRRLSPEAQVGGAGRREELGGRQTGIYLGLEGTGPGEAGTCREGDGIDTEPGFQQWISHLKHRKGWRHVLGREEESRNKWKFWL